MRSQAGFLYDYYGMTEETRLDPPSPGNNIEALLNVCTFSFIGTNFWLIFIKDIDITI